MTGMHVGILFAALATMVSGQTPAPRPRLALEGSGWCVGHFITTRARYSWMAPLGQNRTRVHCGSPYRILSHPSEFDWVLGVDQTKQCPFSAIHVHKYDPDYNRSFWEVDAYQSEDQMKKDEGNVVASCGGMIDLHQKE
jgi:hypothetical protein